MLIHRCSYSLLAQFSPSGALPEPMAHADLGACEVQRAWPYDFLQDRESTGARLGLPLGTWRQ